MEKPKECKHQEVGTRSTTLEAAGLIGSVKFGDQNRKRLPPKPQLVLDAASTGHDHEHTGSTSAQGAGGTGGIWEFGALDS